LNITINCGITNNNRIGNEELNNVLPQINAKLFLSIGKIFNKTRIPKTNKKKVILY
jgi:hypothetical protein